MQNKTIIFFISVFFLSFSIWGQKDISDFLDLQQLEGQEIVNLESINSEEVEFAPMPFRSGILYIHANTNKKRIKENAKIFFQLTFAGGDLISGFKKTKPFDSISTEGEFDGPIDFIPVENTLIATKNQKALFEFEERNEMRLGLYYYIFDQGEWIAYEAFPLNDKRYNVCHPSFDEATGRLYFASDMPGGFGGLDIYCVERKEDGTWQHLRNLGPAINSKENDGFPFIFEEDFLFFSSDRKSSKGGMDIYASVQLEDQWLTAKALPGRINSKWDDYGLSILEDGKQVLFASSREGGKGQDDLYGMLLDHSLIDISPDYLTVRVLKSSDLRALPEVDIRFYRFKTDNAIVEKDAEVFSNIRLNIDPASLKASKVLTTNLKGEVYLSMEDGQYILQAGKENYRSQQQLLDLQKTSEGVVKLYLDSMICKEISLRASDAQSKLAISVNAEISGQDKVIQSDESGYLDLCVKKEKALDLVIRKEAYQDFALRLAYDDLEDGEVIHIAMQPEVIYTEQLPVFSGEYTVLENILYDYDQFTLNDKAKAELDRLAEHMLLYPDIGIELSAHTDSRGGEVYNQVLSEKRAKKAKEYLVAKGIDADRIAATGYGESRPRNHCMDGVKCSEAEHALNRRTEVKVVVAKE
jgi:outer membrane protein OmpA-like peptidoglycan-associated protein